MKKFCLIFILFFILSGCAELPQPDKQLLFKGRIAIAPFEHPILPNDILAGYVVNDQIKIKKDVLLKLDEILIKELSISKVREIIPSNLVRACREIMVQKENTLFLDPVDKWVSIGKCIPADYILVPQLFIFKERVGGEWGVEEPAEVMLSLNLIDVSKGKLLKSYLYREEQKPLMENILDIKKFLLRGGKWVSAMELAKEGIKKH